MFQEHFVELLYLSGKEGDVKTSSSVVAIKVLIFELQASASYATGLAESISTLKPLSSCASVNVSVIKLRNI